MAYQVNQELYWLCKEAEVMRPGKAEEKGVYDTI
jgi:hypothetical protein